MSNTNQWLVQVGALVTSVESRLETLGETEKLHVDTLARELESSTNIKLPVLKLMVASLVNATPGFKVSRGKFGGISRDNEANQPKAKPVAKAPRVRKPAQVEVPEVVAANSSEEIVEQAV